ncbi:hypothetical protein Clacol_000828 [Clathrus columnatus]|uniref:Transcriptional adapter 2 n=1 Tax=Clathrus columnatus TaxID=1419009 RepID=A0AAV5A029_9AGAM|nr:hypothetical protein Clacol_000828 [Clathrus columnatus]
MTVTHRKRPVPDETVINEPGLQVECDACRCDLTHSVRIKCADSVCEEGEGIDICPVCFTKGAEFKQHQRTHPYRIIELHSYPIFDEDWGADEELFLNEGLSLQGLGNWAAVAEHIGTRTKEEVEQHYRSRMDLTFDIPIPEFQARKKRRIETLTNHLANPIAPKPPVVSTPGVHEIAGYLPGRLEFEHEMDNEAEDTVKDLEFGLVLDFGGEELPEDENDIDVKARKKWEETNKLEKVAGKRKRSESLSSTPLSNGNKRPIVNGINGHTPSSKTRVKQKTDDGAEGSVTTTTKDGENENEESAPAPIVPYETNETTQFKLALLDIYYQRVARRHEAKTFIFQRGLLEYKKMIAADKKRQKEEREFVHKFRPFAKLQTSDDYEEFVNGMLCTLEAALRRRIQELQHYRRLGITTSSEVDKYESELYHRNARKANPSFQRDQSADRFNHVHRQISRASFPPDSAGAAAEADSREGDVPKPHPSVGRKPVAPLNLANAPSLHLLTAAEQTICSQLRIMPKAYLLIKDTLVREFARRGGKLRRREARELVKIDVNKTSRVWDFLFQAGVLRVPEESPQSTAPSAPATSATITTTTNATLIPSNGPINPAAPSPSIATKSLVAPSALTSDTSVAATPAKSPSKDPNPVSSPAISSHAVPPVNLQNVK